MEDFWQEFHAWERQTAEAWANLIRSPEFIQAMNRQLESALLLRQQLDQTLEAMLKSAMLPTASEQERILRLVRQLENQAQELSERVERLSARVDAAGR